MFPLFCDPMNCSPPGSFVHEIFQARILEWAAISPSRYLPDQGSNLCLCFSFLAEVFFTTEPPGKPSHIWIDCIYSVTQQILAAAAKPLQSCPTLCDPTDCPPGSPVPGILQARTLEWVAIYCVPNMYQGASNSRPISSAVRDSGQAGGHPFRGRPGRLGPEAALRAPFLGRHRLPGAWGLPGLREVPRPWPRCASRSAWISMMSQEPIWSRTGGGPCGAEPEGGGC